MRAHFVDFGAELLPELHAALHGCSDYGALAKAGMRLLNLAGTKVGVGSTDGLLMPILSAVRTRLLWLLEGLVGPKQPAHANDVAALRLVERMLDPRLCLGIDQASVPATLQRLAAAEDLPPALRGASFAVLWRQQEGVAMDASLLAAIKAFAHGEQLGDFLFGVFALARNECARSESLIAVLDQAVCDLPEHDFLLAAAALRQAFHYFPPRERAQIGDLVGELHGLRPEAQPDWLSAPSSVEDLQRSARLLETIGHLQVRYGL